MKVQDLIDFLDSEECIADATAREETIGFLHNKLNIILRAIPEFETIAAVILSISIITVIALTSKSKLSLARKIQ
jgi:predicted secreted protein with PEFG-CTERM motif